MIDIEPKVPIEDLDPERHSAGYWTRFHATAMDSARPHLLRRRGAPVTVGDILLSWSRLVLPFTATAAAVAALLLVRAPEFDDLSEVAGLEELLHQNSNADVSLPDFLYRDAEVNRDMILLALEEF
jgi:hypothetical protein